MKLSLTKFFRFSASHAREGKIYAHNYVLGVTADAAEGLDEEKFEQSVREGLIRKLDARDLGEHVDFLKGARLTDDNLLAVFWPLVKKLIHPAGLRALTLERDERTRVSLSDENL